MNNPIEYIPFQPLFGCSSPHLQTVLGCFSPAGTAPPSQTLIIPLADGDAIACEISTPPNWKETDKTMVLLHGLGGSHESPYMIRFSRKLYNAGHRAVRVNMRGCGSGNQLATRPYHGGMSHDILPVIETLSKAHSQSPLYLIGFSLGGNIVLKLAGELGEQANKMIKATFAICPPVDLAQTAALLARPLNRYYNQYYMRSLEEQTYRWTNGQSFSNIYEFDNLVTAPLWKFQGAFDYYQQCSSHFFLSNIKHPCYILFAADDPFIDFRTAVEASRTSFVKIWMTNHGGHMGFLGWSGKEHFYFWLDSVLFKWLSENF